MARGFTRRSLILKAHGGYHGTYSDLEAGLHGQGEIPGHTLLAEFNNADSFERVLERHGKDIAAVVLEPVMYTGVVMPALPGFLDRVQKAANRVGALFVLDDCLMFRLAPGGSAEKFGLSPDIIFLGKFIGGGLPAGAVGARAEIMDRADPALGSGGVYHGGSFNGNALSAVAGRTAIEHLTAERIAAMDQAAQKLKQALEAKAQSLGISLYVLDEGSVMGLYFSESKPRPGAPMPNEELSNRFHLACLNHGVQTGPGCMIAMATVIDDAALAAAIGGMCQALTDIRP
jgi:glutamate-1-semialdehyde 2,1-aminomutase